MPASLSAVISLFSCEIFRHVNEVLLRDRLVALSFVYFVYLTYT